MPENSAENIQPTRSYHIRQNIDRIKTQILTKETAASLGFVLALVVFEGRVLTISYDKYIRNIQQHQYSIVLAAFGVILFSLIWLALFFWSSLNSRPQARLVYLLIFSVAEFTEYGYQNAFERFSSIEDLRIAYNATAEQWGGSILAYIDWRAAVPCIAYAILLFSFKRNRKYSWKSLGLVLALIACYYSAVSPYISGQFATISLPAFLRTLTTSPWKWGSGYNGPREAITFHSEQEPQNNIVLIIDESVRSDHLSVNGYSRQTTPYLEELLRQKILHTWGTAAAGTTCSATSDNLLLTGLSPVDLPDARYEIRKRPSLFQYAKAMGYKTHYFDGQKDGFWLGTAFDVNYVDDWRPVGSFAEASLCDRDALIARRVNEILDGSRGNFIWITKRGVHYPYVRAYPPQAAEWQPAATSISGQIDPSRREGMINTYDNALKYNLESFFRSLDIPNRRAKNFFLYTSDHGQTLSEHGERRTHCGMSVDTQPTEAMVPLFLISVEPLLVDTHYKASHSNIFATLLDLMAFPTSERRRPYAPSLLATRASDSQQRYFFVGDLHQKIFNGRLLFDR